MKNLTRIIAGSSLLAVSLSTAFTAQAVEGLSANAAVSSNYLWRGVTQTDDGAAMSGGIDYAGNSGFYAGTWASNIDFGGDASYELDAYFGFSGAIGDISYDTGYIYYAYPDDANDIDLGEIYGSLSYSYFTVGANLLTQSGDDAFSDGVDDDWLYVFADAAFEVAPELELGLHIGSFTGDAIEDWMGDEYIDYSVSLSKGGFSLMVSDTDLDGAVGEVKLAVTYSLDFDL